MTMTTLSPEEREGLERLSHEDLAKLLGLIREARAMFRVGGAMPSSAFEDLVKAVPDKLVREVVADLKGGRAEPGWLPPPKPKGPEERRGPAKEVPLGSPPGLRWIDQMVDVQDARDRAERLKGFGSAGLGGPTVLTKDDAKEGR